MPTPPPPDLTLVSELAAAYHRHLPDILAVDDDDLVQMDRDPRVVAFTVLGALAEVRRFDGAIRSLPACPLAAYENVEGYAQALYHAHALYLDALSADDEVTALYFEATQRRGMLLADAATLIERAPAERVGSSRGRSGFERMASDLLSVAGVLDARWPAIAGKTALTRADLQRGRWVAEALVRAASLGEAMPAAVVQAQRNRQRAYSLVVRAWGEVRRAVALIRADEGDVERIAPSLRSGHDEA